MKKINGIIMQYFEWYMETNQNLWNKLARRSRKASKARDNSDMVATSIQRNRRKRRSRIWSI